MANELTLTTESALIREVWGPRYLSALYDPMMVASKCLNIVDDFKGKGDIAHIAVQSTAYSPSDIGSDGAVTPDDDTLTDTTITVDKERAVVIEILRATRAQSLESRIQDFAKNAGDAIREDIDEEILGLYSGVTQTQGAGTGNVGEDELLAAVAQLGKNKLPVLSKPGEFFLAFHFQQWPSLKRSSLLDFNRSGLAGKGGAATGELPGLYGIDVIFTNQVAANGTIHENILAHRTAFAWAAQRMPQFEAASGLPAKKITDVFAVWALYGADVAVANRAVRLRSVTS